MAYTVYVMDGTVNSKYVGKYVKRLLLKCIESFRNLFLIGYPNGSIGYM
jgi:uncharacterized membrane-anchored protein